MSTERDEQERRRVAELYEAHGPGVYRFLYRLCGSVTDAEDLTSETFLAAMMSLRHFRGDATESTWLLRIARNLWRQKVRRDIVRRVFRPAVGAAPRFHEAVGLDLAIDSLPPVLKEAFILTKVEGRTSLESSRILGCPQGTVQGRVAEACRRLRIALGTSDLPLTPNFANEAKS